MHSQILSLAFSAAMMLVAAGAFAAESPSLSPTTAPSSARHDQIRQWFNELADTDPSVREQARVALMGLKLDELGALRQVVDESRPVAPSQATVLHDIVVQLYVEATRVRLGDMELELFVGDPYPAFRKSGFLGVLLDRVQAGPFGAPPDDVVNFGTLGGGGVLIRETWPGFAGFRYLRAGDIVVGIGGAGVRAVKDADAAVVLDPVEDLKKAVSATVPGRTLELRVLRQGRVVTVPVNVTVRPPWAQPREEIAIRQIQRRRLDKAELYWNVAFRPLLTHDGDAMS